LKIYQTAAMAVDGVQWHLKYNQGSASSYKWEVMGATALSKTVLPAETSASASYADLATLGPDVVLPLAGDYDVTITVELSQSSTQWAIASFAIGAATASDDNRVLAFQNLAAGQRTSRITVATALTLRAKYRTSGAGTGTFARRTLSAVPIRVG
jgi:hypothetical protein